MSNSVLRSPTYAEASAGKTAATTATSAGKTAATTATLCFHCRQTGPAAGPYIGDKYFCCEGCKTVYEILSANDLCDFYLIDKKAGKKAAEAKSARVYAYLDDPEVAEKLLEFNDGHTAQITFYLPQMHCAGCIWLLEHLYKLDEGLSSSRVNFLKKTATLQFDTAQTSLSKIAALLSSIGYAPEINLGDVDGAKPPGLSRNLAYQIGIAGFAFGNIMLLSFPEYVGMSREADPWFSWIFGCLSLVLALPVLLYSAKDYYISAWSGLRTRHLNIDVPLVLAFSSLFGRSVYEILSRTGAGYLDSFAGLVLLMLTGKWFQQSTWNRLSFERDYKSYFPVAATVKNGAEERSAPVNRLVPGDIIVVRNQEIIPADGLLVRNAARIDYSFVTGESEPVLVQNGEPVFAGGKQIGERIEIALTRRVAQSRLTQLWNNEAFKPQAKGQVTRLADAAGRYFTALILAFGLGSVIYWWGFRGDAATALNAFTAVMIVACPCIIALSIPFTLGNIQRILGRHRFYLKNIRVVEAFTAIDTVIFDKTGTITNVADPQLHFQGEPLSRADETALRSLARHSAHPLSRQLYESMRDVPVEEAERFEEIPGLGIRGIVAGKEVMIGSKEFVSAKAGNGIFVAVNGRVLGYFDVKSQYRTGLDRVLAFFRGKGHTEKNRRPAAGNVWLLSGDRDRDTLNLASFFPDPAAMRFQCSPQEKLDFVKSLQEHGKNVLMLGDGLNDAGALRQSDLGIVIAENTNNFTPACDAILHADEFARLPQFVRLARAGVKIVNRSYAVALTYNMIGVGFAVSGNLSPLVAAILMPMSSVSIVLFGVGMGNWSAMRLLHEKDRPNKTVMD